MPDEPQPGRGLQVGRVSLGLAQAVGVVGVYALIRSGRLPLGIPGEWEWTRITFLPRLDNVLLAVVAILIYAGYAAFGYARLAATKPGASRLGAGLLVLGLAGMGGFVQVAVQEGAPEGYGLTKWVMALQESGASGYYTVIKNERGGEGGTAGFLKRYPDWIQKQDALHVGTHPPGLFLIAAATLDLMERQPTWAVWLLKTLPPSVEGAFKVIKSSDLHGRLASFRREDAASLALTSLLTMILCAGTVAPLYALGRRYLSADSAWAAASLWPLVPSAILFQPVSDTLYPFLSTLALAAAIPGPRRFWGLAAALVSGLVMGLGMQLSLVFLAVGLIAAILVVSRRDIPWPRRIETILAIGVGFIGFTLAFWAATSANPLVIWWANQKNHARFYVEYPRSYAPWVIANVVELALAIGLASTLALLVGTSRPRAIPAPTWATLGVLAFLTLSGKNLSEVARLWIPLMPPLLLGAAAGLKRLESKPGLLAWTLLWVGLQTLSLEMLIQVVYPVAI